jgi:hypothetical protein
VPGETTNSAPVIVVTGAPAVGKTAVGHLVAETFDRGVHLKADGLAAACATRDLECHYALLQADLDTCWSRAESRGEGRWPLERDPFVGVHTRFRELALPTRHVVDAMPAAASVRDAVVAAHRSGQLAV